MTIVLAVRWHMRAADETLLLKLLKPLVVLFPNRQPRFGDALCRSQLGKKKGSHKLTREKG